MSAIKSILHETRVFPPSADFVRQANVAGIERYQALCTEAEKDLPGFWSRPRGNTSLGIRHSPGCWMKAIILFSNGLTTAN